MGSKFSLKKSLLFAKSEYTQWIMNPKMCILVVMGIFIYQFVIQPIIQTAEQMQCQISVFEPFVALGTSGMVLLILPLVYMVLMSEFPRMKSGDWYWIIRLGRSNWILGQILFGFFSICSYLFFVALICIIPVLFKSSWSLEWSNVVLKYRLYFPEKRGDFVAELFPENLYNQMSIRKALCNTYILLVCYLFLVLLILLVANLCKKRVVGIVLAVVIIATGTALCSLQSDAMWFFPMSHSVVWLHYTEYYREQVVPITTSYLYFAFTILLLFIFCLIKVYTYQYDSQEV